MNKLKHWNWYNKPMKEKHITSMIIFTPVMVFIYHLIKFIGGLR